MSAGRAADVTALVRLARARRRLGAVAALRPLLVTAALALVVAALLAVAAGAGWIRPNVARAAGGALAVALVAGGAVRGVRAWRRTTAAEAALWIERRLPALDYALATLADPRVQVGAATRARLEARARTVAWEPVVNRAVLRALAGPTLAAVAGVALVALAPTGAARGREARASAAGGDAGAARRAGAAATLAFRVRVLPPAYSGLAARELGDASAVAALEGSTLELRGPRADAPVRATLGDRALPVREDGEEWRLALPMPARPAALRLTRGAASRLVALEPRRDSLPVVELRLPVRDTVLREAAGRLSLAARAQDDLGLTTARLEYIVSSGEGENFEFRSGTLGERAVSGARAASVEATFDLGALALAPGDVVHLRATARDANPRAGFAASETRTLRVMRRGEADSVAVEAAPPPEADKSLLSQRMLIRLTEALVARAPRLGRPALVDESRRIAADQKRLRKAVGDVVFARLGGEASAEHAHGAGDGHDHSAEELAALRTPEQVLAAADRATGRGADAVLDFEGDETPVVAINRPLLEAYNAMWEASLSLEVGEPREALPPMRRALEAIQRARAAERVYLRGRPPAVVVDLARVRLAGKERGDPGARAPREPVPDATRAIAARLGRVATLVATDPVAAADSLLLLRVEALGAGGDAAATGALARALGDAAEALRRGGDVTAALVRARRAAAGGAATTGAPGAWRGGWSPAGEASRP